jgi:hypothetical protein
MNPEFGPILNQALGHRRSREAGESLGYVDGASSTVLQAVLTSGQDYPHRGVIHDYERLAQSVRVSLDIFSEDLDRSWLLDPGSHPVAGCDRSMTLGDILRLLLRYLPDAAPTPKIYEEIHAILREFKFLRHWRYGWSRRSH